MSSVRARKEIIKLLNDIQDDHLNHTSYCAANCGPEGEGWTEPEKCNCGILQIRERIKAAITTLQWANDADKAAEAALAALHYNGSTIGHGDEIRP